MVAPDHPECVSFLCRHRATDLEKELEEFTTQYLQPQQWAAPTEPSFISTFHQLNYTTGSTCTVVLKKWVNQVCQPKRNLCMTMKCQWFIEARRHTSACQRENVVFFFFSCQAIKSVWRPGGFFYSKNKSRLIDRKTICGFSVQWDVVMVNAQMWQYSCLVFSPSALRVLHQLQSNCKTDSLRAKTPLGWSQSWSGAAFWY